MSNNFFNQGRRLYEFLAFEADGMKVRYRIECVD